MNQAKQACYFVTDSLKKTGNKIWKKNLTLKMLRPKCDMCGK